jgi:uncharacterized protein (DUF1778 family)
MPTTAASGKFRVGARLDLRLPEQTKSRIERAAEITGSSATEFVRTAADDAARKVLADYEQTVLTGADRKAFFAALLNPEKPSPDLLDAARRHKKLVSKS